MSEILTATVDAVCSANFRVPDTHDEVSSARALQRRGTARVVVTRGQRPVRWWDGDRSGTTPVPQVVVRDTLGAGDAFHGAYAHARARNLSVPEAADLAVAVASLRVRFPGPRSWLDHLDDLTVPAGAPQERTS